ncbi:MAG: NAD-dependent epimerase/dehydratase family protein [Chloroflexi bacterium]|nr:NAD-dependent epimerase/dehydratase family protein [Chloroflexota bacterium]
MNCAVFGGEGFIGSHLVEQLVGSGHNVTIFDRQRNPFVFARPAARLIRGDFADPVAVGTAARGMDVVFHLIGSTVPQTSNEDLFFDFQSNVMATIRLLQACTQAGVGKVVFLSSGGTVYGIPRQVPIPETHPTEPVCSYGLTKLMVEKYMALSYHLYGLDYAVLRCANAYGERQNPGGKQGAVAVFLGRLVRDLPIVVWGDGEVIRDYVYVQDIVRGLEMAALSSAEQRVLNIGSGVGFSIKQLLGVIEEVSGQTPAVEYSDPRSYDVPVNVLDISLVRRVLGWEPQFDLVSGLERTWNWIRDWGRLTN